MGDLNADNGTGSDAYSQRIQERQDEALYQRVMGDGDNYALPGPDQTPPLSQAEIAKRWKATGQSLWSFGQDVVKGVAGAPLRALEALHETAKTISALGDDLQSAAVEQAPWMKPEEKEQIRGKMQEYKDTLHKDGLTGGLLPEPVAQGVSAVNQSMKPDTQVGSWAHELLDLGVLVYLLPGGTLSKALRLDSALRARATLALMDAGRWGMAEALKNPQNITAAESEIRAQLVRVTSTVPGAHAVFKEVLTTADSALTDLEARIQAGLFTAGATAGLHVLLNAVPIARAIRQSIGRTLTPQEADDLLMYSLSPKGQAQAQAALDARKATQIQDARWTGQEHWAGVKRGGENDGRTPYPKGGSPVDLTKEASSEVTPQQFLNALATD